jgi:hypothetical protein
VKFWKKAAFTVAAVVSAAAVVASPAQAASPLTRPPSSAEHFVRDGDWVLLDGRETLRRDIAQGLDMAFTIDQQVASPRHAEATAYWNW